MTRTPHGGAGATTAWHYRALGDAMRLGVPPHRDGRHVRPSARRLILCAARALTCLHGHRLKPQPYLLGPVGLACSHRRPGGALACDSLAYYAPHHTSVVAVEATAGELLTIAERGMDMAAALDYLGVSPSRA
jgi:hypothetical protein